MPEEPIFTAQEARVSSPPGARFVLTAADITIFKLIYQYRLVRLEHLCALTGRSGKRLHRRIFKLVRHRYLSVIKLPQQKHIYALAKRALPVLVEQGTADPEVLAKRIRIHELKELFLKHEMMVVDIHAVLSLATAGSGDLHLVDWQEGRKLHDYVSISDYDGLTRLPVRPDASFTLEDSRRPEGKNRSNFFLEADRSSENQARFRDKISAYWHYLEQGLYTKKFGPRAFRVVTVTMTRARAENLCVLATSFLPEGARKYFLFTSLQNFSIVDPASILGEIYLSPRRASSAGYPLVPVPGPSQTEAAGV